MVNFDLTVARKEGSNRVTETVEIVLDGYNRRIHKLLRAPNRDITLAVTGHLLTPHSVPILRSYSSSMGGKEGWQMEKRHPGSERCLLAHDLNNDLRVILKRCELLERQILDVESNKHVNFIRAAAEHMAERIAQRPCDYVQPRTKAG